MFMNISYQGEKGSYSEKVIHDYIGVECNLINHKTFEDVADSLNNNLSQFSIIPIENSLGGSIHSNYDILLKYEFEIIGELLLKVDHCLLCHREADISQIKKVISHPQAISQCKNYIQKKSLSYTEVYDTAGSAKIIMEQRLLDVACIAGKQAANVYNLKIIEENIQDNDNNYTRFVILKKKSNQINPIFLNNKNIDSSQIKTSIIFKLKNAPSILYKALSIFSIQEIDLTKIESRPYRTYDNLQSNNPFEYIFYLDFIGDIKEERVINSINNLKEISIFVKILGSYSLLNKKVNSTSNILANTHSKVSKLLKQNKQIYSLHVGETDDIIDQTILNKMIECINNKKIKYTEISGQFELRKQICLYLFKQKNLKYTEKQIICTNGAKQAIFETVKAICNIGDEVIIFSPYWTSYPEIVKLVNAIPIFIKTDSNNNFEPNIENIENKITHKTKLIIICNPNNPCGTIYSKQFLEKLAIIISKYQNLYILSDEIYEIYDYNSEHISFASLPNMIKKTITINGFSKAFSMTGLRIGYAAGPQHIITKMCQMQSHITGCASKIAQDGAINALKMQNLTIYLKLISNMMKEKRDKCIQILNDNNFEMNSTMYNGAFYLFLNIQKYLKNDILTDIDFCNRLLDEYQVAVCPGIAFGCSGYIRIAYASNSSIDGIKRLCQFCNNIVY